MLNYVVDSSHEIVANFKKKWSYLFENIIYLFIYLSRISLFDIILLFHTSFLSVCNVGMYWRTTDTHRYNNFPDFSACDIIPGRWSLPLQLPAVDDNHGFVFSMWCIGNKYVYRVVGEGIRCGGTDCNGSLLVRGNRPQG